MMPDEIVLKGTPPEAVKAALEGATVTGIGRKGKYWWIELDRRPWVFGHLGMTGYLVDLSSGEVDRRVHGIRQGEENGDIRFLKLLIETEDGGRIAFTDGRRLARLWLAESPSADKSVSALGFDVRDELPPATELHARLVKRKAPLKAILMDQGFFAGVGNYMADETMFQARLSPHRLGSSLTLAEVKRLRQALESITDHAITVGADYVHFPDDWLFHHRWGGGRGPEHYQGHPIQRDQIGGRTTAWVPKLQR